MLTNPVTTRTPAQMRLRLFWGAALMSFLQTTGVWLTAHGYLLTGAAGFLIAYNWTGRNRDVNDYRIAWSRGCYGLGGAAGALLGLQIMKALVRMHLI
jgi:hypothetical protein